ncbi:MAG: hypothetical protein PHP52_01860 [Bacteroidales bacterium]|nr:hypothetical protein [Bacteroidales bacterium]MDD4216416.1 hypothetical protein [Bacteroidales bacterium]MDY0142590.1 hypothetical protein [Bacteroidales bacterium]
MKTYLKYFAFLLLVSIAFSCNNKKKEESKKQIIEKAETLKQLKEKYGNYKFKNCDDLLEAGDEIMDVYIETVNRAYKGDSLAKKDLDRFDTFMSQYDAIALTLSSECPERFEEWAAKTEDRISQIYPKIDKIYRSDFETESFQYDEELEKQLNKEVEDLNKQVKEALGKEEFSLKNK